MDDDWYDDSTPAVTPVVSPRAQPLVSGGESPVRVVAVLDESVLVDRSVGRSVGRQQEQQQERRGSSRTLIGAIAGLVLVALVAGAAFLVTRSNDAASSPDRVTLDDAQNDRVEDLEADGVADDLPTEAPDVDTAPDALDADVKFDPGETIAVGALRVVNGTSVLAELAEWHQGYAEDRGIEPGLIQGCWFGQLGRTAVQVAHCGPVSGSADTEYLFDLVPVNFIDVQDGQFAQPDTESVTPDSVIANAITLIGSPDGPAPPQ